MSKYVINGRVYNTETAKELGHDSVGDGFSSYRETLYRTKKGAFFLVGSGGPMTRYARRCGQNSWSGGSGCFVLSRAEALEWCENHDVDADDVEKEFDLIEG